MLVSEQRDVESPACKWTRSKAKIPPRHQDNCVRRRRTQILILPWARSGCQIDLRDFRPGDRLDASTSCATVSDMVTKSCFSCAMMYWLRVGFWCRGHFLHRIQFLPARWTAYNRQPNQSTDRDSTIAKYSCLCKPVRLWRIVTDFFKSERFVFCKNC